MNLSTVTPPINNACLPDIYNRLDANVLERTKVVNGQLQLKLSRQEKIIAKYKLEAERLRRRQRQSAAKDLSRIRQVPATVRRVRNFDEKFLADKPRQLSPIERAPKEKHYLQKTNEDPICKRCYIHHLPTKKKIYRVESPPPPTSILDANGSKTHRPAATHGPSRSESPEKKAASAPASVLNPSPVLNSPVALDLDSNNQQQFHSPSPDIFGGYGRRSKLVPQSMKYQFLERHPWGKEIDLNKTLTPRLVANEEWKNVVKNVCSQTERRLKPIRKASVVWRGTRMNSFLREKSIVGANRRTSGRRSSRGRQESRPSSRVTQPISRSNSRSESFTGKQRSRKASATDEPRRMRKLSQDGSSLSAKGLCDNSQDLNLICNENGSSKSRKNSRDNSSLSAKDLERLRLSSPAKSYVASRSGSVLKSHKE